MRAAASRTFCTAGSTSPIRIAMMAITTSNSINVNADLLRIGSSLCFGMFALVVNGESVLRARTNLSAKPKLYLGLTGPLIGTVHEDCGIASRLSWRRYVRNDGKDLRIEVRM